MDTYTIDGIIKVRTGTEEEWSYSLEPNKGALRILEKGEIGWVYETSKLKIGDGITKFRDLPWFEPNSPLAEYLGNSTNKFSYDDIKTALSDLELSINNVKQELDSKITEIRSDIDTNSTKYYNSFLNFPSVGIEGPLYVDATNGDIYYWNNDSSHGDTIGYKKLTNSFNRIECVL